MQSVDDLGICVVSVRELSRATTSVLGRVRDHERVIVTRHGHPVAVLLSVLACIDLAAEEGMVWPRGREERARMKRELIATILGPQLDGQAKGLQFRRICRMLDPMPTGARGFYGR
jgi:prevent-host-death family protein